MGSLIIIPAATAKRLATTLNSMLVTAVVIATASTPGGTVLARFIHRDTGPVTIALAAATFFVSLLARKR